MEEKGEGKERLPQIICLLESSNHTDGGRMEIKTTLKQEREAVPLHGSKILK